jgi:hypothetical protein
MRAVDEVRELQQADEVADALLALYRRGGGPQPSLVLASVDHARQRGKSSS